jgi:hypothetical protein
MNAADGHRSNARTNDDFLLTARGESLIVMLDLAIEDIRACEYH